MVEFIRSTETFPFFMMVAFFVGMAGVAFYAAMRARKIAGAIASTPTTKISHATAGRVAVEGKVQAIEGKTIQAPLTLTPCCWFRAKLEEYETRHERDETISQWKVLKSESSMEPFMCSDGLGLCAVYPLIADVTPTDKSVWYGATKEPADKNPKRYGPGENPQGGFKVEGTKDTRFRYTEERIYANDPLYVLGNFSKDPRFGQLTEAEMSHDKPSLWSDEKRVNEFAVAAAKLAPGQLSAPQGRAFPFIISTTPRTKLLEVNKAGSKGALIVMLLPLAIAAGLCWIRFIP